LKRFVFALSIVFLGLTGVASAQSSPAPGPAPTPMVREKFVVIDGGFGGKTYNELSPGNSTTALAIRGAVEAPVIGHTWMAAFDYTTWQYTHHANANLGAGIVSNCPAGDPGCVTPIGFATINVTSPTHVALFVPGLSATDTQTHIGLSSKISKDQRYYIGAGYLFKTENYGGYPSLSGFGLGIDKLPDFDTPLSFYGSFWQYADMQGTFGGYNSPLIGASSGRGFSLEYKMYTYRLGINASFKNSPLFVEANIAGDRADARNNAPSDIAHGALFLGAGVHF
jgi:hypothetical protein